MNLKKSLSLLVVSILSVGFFGCGGGGNNGSSAIATTTSGNFKDANVIGVQYKSGSQSGLTGTQGNYICENGKNITFSIGKVVLGSVPCNTLITPIDLISNGNINNVGVINIVRFLTALDDDGNVSNGMNITSKIRTLADAWTNIDFTSSTFDTDTNVTVIFNDIQNNIGPRHSLPTAAVAKAHLQSTLRCAYSGAFAGNYTGGDTGGVGALISPIDGTMLIVGYSDSLQSYFSGQGTQSFQLDSTRNIQGSTVTGATFNGTINSVNSVSGTWNNTGVTGNWKVTRIGGATDAKYRVVGGYNNTNGAVGLFSFDIDTSNHITGIAYNTFEDKKYTISGTFNGRDINATASDGTIISANFDPLAGTITNAQLSNTVQSTSGTFTGSGCALN